MPGVFRSALYLLPILMVSLVSVASDYSPYIGEDYPRNLYWGDTHVHSAYSVDAAVLGRTRLSPVDAYRFAIGEEVTATNGMLAKLIRPLDFIVLSDHAEYLGLMQAINRSDPLLLETKTGRRWFDQIRKGGDDFNTAMYEILIGLAAPNKINSEPLRRSAWDQVIANAEQFNEPGKFTAFIGYEWTSNTIKGDNLHRNVIFRDDASFTSKTLPFTAQHSLDPEDLWSYLDAYESKTGGRVLAIAHNGNLSNGLMFDNQTLSGEPLDKHYAASRARWEPLYEVTQIKGDGEAHPLLSPDDEFADYENWDTGNLSAMPKPEQALQFEYARSGLKLGLNHQRGLGANPFKFGMIGSTDSHTGLATAREENFWGKFSKFEPGPGRMEAAVLPPPPGQDIEKSTKAWKSVASGYAGIWAQKNTRESLFAAMQRKEVYATTGPRMAVRFFGGWDYDQSLLQKPQWVKEAYSKGVPMGGDLPAIENPQAPVFVASAMKDPDGANLDRIQLIKGWSDEQGELHERIYDIAVSGQRTIDTQGRTKQDVGNTVDIANATFSNVIGAAQLSARWQDPDFNSKQHAFYYLRVIEIPTPRWTAFDKKRFQLQLGPEISMTTEERAYTSPIWYTPNYQ